jgi:hypothetical protein
LPQKPSAFADGVVTYRYCDEALYDQTIQEPDLRGLERLKEDGLYLLGAVMLTVMGAGLLAKRYCQELWNGP